MNYLSRAITSIKRQRGKNLVFLLLIYVIGNLMVGAIVIRSAVSNVDRGLRANMPAVGTVEMSLRYTALNCDEFFESFGEERRFPTQDELLQIAKLPYVREFEYMMTLDIFIRNWQSFIDGRMPTDLPWWEMENLRTTFGEFERVNIMGVSNPSMVSFESDAMILIMGRTFTQEEIDQGASVILVSQEIANLNHLSIGSIVTLENVVFDDYEYWSHFAETGSYNFDLLDYDTIHAYSAHEFKVIGIFEPQLEINDEEINSQIPLLNGLTNRIFLPVAVADKLEIERFQMIDENTIRINELLDLDLDLFPEGLIRWMPSLFLLHNPLDFQAFANAADEFLPAATQVVAFSEDFTPIFNTMDNFKGMSELILWTVAGASMVIITLIITLYMKERKQELGIYLSLGEKKIKIFTQIFTEVFGVALIGITLSIFTGSFFAESLSQNMLISQIQEQEIASADDMFGEFSNGINTLRGIGHNFQVSIEEVAEAYQIALGPIIILTIYGIGIITIFIATIMPIIYVTKLNPKKILM